MLYSPRLKRILNLVLRLPDDEYIPIDQIAASLKTSRRTVFRELENVNDLLTLDGLTLESRSGKGIRLLGDAAHREALLEALSVEDVSYYNKDERRRLLAFELLRTPSIRKLVYYASMFEVSEATISHDIDALIPSFEECGLRLVRRGKNRIELHGSESSRRRTMVRIVHDELPQLALSRGIDPASSSLETIFLKGEPEGIMSLLNQNILRRVLQIFEISRHELGLDRFSQSSYIGLILHLVVAIERILDGESIEADCDVVSLVRNPASMEDAANIARRLETEFDIRIPDVEIALIAMHLEGSKVSTARDLDAAKDAAPDVINLADSLISGFSLPVQMQLRSDEQFLQGLVTHLEPALVRIRNRLPIYNPLLASLREQYKELFEATRQAARTIEEQCSLRLSDEEIGFITMHVGAALERAALRQSQRPVRIGVVCASGIGVSALLAARIEKQFGSGVRVQTFSMEDLRSRSLGQSELLVSTFPVDLPDLDSIQVSPLLSDQDSSRIEARLKVLERRDEPLRPIPATYRQKLERLRHLIEAQQQILDGLKTVRIETAADRSDLIEQAARALSGDSNSLCRDLLEREKLGSVAAEDFGFAMFHAASPAARQAQMIFLYPAAPDTFASIPDLKAVRVIAAAVLPQPSDEQARQALSLLSEALIDSPAFLQAVLSGDALRLEEQICLLFQKHLEETFETL